MFGLAFGLLAFILFSGFLSLAIIVAPYAQIAQRVSDLPFLYKSVIFGLVPYILGVLAQKGLERAIKKYSKH